MDKHEFELLPSDNLPINENVGQPFIDKLAETPVLERDVLKNMEDEVSIYRKKRT